MRENYRKFFTTNSCNFMVGATKLQHFPKHNMKEVGFIGRSNVGKSSLLNALLGRKSIAKVSNTPGRTRQVNFFCLGDKLYIVDLPGYGYAKLSHKERDSIERLINMYLFENTNPKEIYLLLDIRHKPFPADMLMIDFLETHDILYHVVFTKIDKINKAQENQQVSAMLDILPPDLSYVVCSSKTGEGLDELRAHIYSNIYSYK